MHLSMVNQMGKSLSNLIFMCSESMGALPWLCEEPQARSAWGLSRKRSALQGNNAHTGFISSEIPSSFAACAQKLRKQKSGELTSIPCFDFNTKSTLSPLPIARSNISLAIQLAKMNSNEECSWSCVNRDPLPSNVSLPQPKTTISST